MVKIIDVDLKTAMGVAAAFITAASGIALAADPQKDLKPVINSGERVLEFDWPMISVGTGEYEEGPTGLTVIRFDKKVYSAVDARGGGPGTVNAPYMELGYDIPELDALVIAGGSWYGLEGVTAVASALKDDGLRDGNAFALDPSIAMSVGSIIFDFGGRRFNEVYPDKRLAQAAFRGARKGKFPLGAHGGGRNAVTGSVFGCHAKSGQGAAFKQYGEVKIAAFTVVNALGVVVDRDGRVAACNKGEGWPADLHVKDLMAGFPASRENEWAGGAYEHEPKNTTISVIVTNQKLTVQELKRMAVQVNSSLGRSIQPYSTIFDGDVLYAVSTAEVEEQVFHSLDLGVLASEVMWDAVLASVPEQPVKPVADEALQIDQAVLRSYEGEYRFSDLVSVRVAVRRGKLAARAIGERRAFAVAKDEWTPLIPVSENQFTADSRYPFLATFGDNQMVMNPGRWEQTGKRVDN